MDEPSSANASRRCVDMSPSRNFPVHQKYQHLLQLLRHRPRLIPRSRRGRTHGARSASFPPSPSCATPPSPGPRHPTRRQAPLPAHTSPNSRRPTITIARPRHSSAFGLGGGRTGEAQIANVAAVLTPTCLRLDKCPVLLLDLRIAKPAGLGHVTIRPCRAAQAAAAARTRIPWQGADRALRCAGCRNTPPPPQRRRLWVHANTSQVRALAAAVRARMRNPGTYASPSLSRPLLRLTDGMSSMCRFPGSYVLCCGGARAGGPPPPRPRPPLLGNPLLPRGNGE